MNLSEGSLLHSMEIPVTGCTSNRTKTFFEKLLGGVRPMDAVSVSAFFQSETQNAAIRINGNLRFCDVIVVSDAVGSSPVRTLI
jgi:hypothetical protein